MNQQPKLTLAWRLLTVVVMTWCLIPAVVAASPPNIVVILSDDMGYADVPGFGADKEIPMPNLDRLAQVRAQAGPAFLPPGLPDRKEKVPREWAMPDCGPTMGEP